MTRSCMPDCETEICSNFEAQWKETTGPCKQNTNIGSQTDVKPLIVPPMNCKYPLGIRSVVQVGECGDAQACPLWCVNARTTCEVWKTCTHTVQITPKMNSMDIDSDANDWQWARRSAWQMKPIYLKYGHMMLKRCLNAAFDVDVNVRCKAHDKTVASEPLTGLTWWFIVAAF